MSWLSDKLKAKLQKKKNNSNVGKKYKKTPLKDITFLSGTASSVAVTEHVNDRMQYLINQVGGLEKFADGDFSIEFVDKTNNFTALQLRPSGGNQTRYGVRGGNLCGRRAERGTVGR